jgi:hypothetical protein
VKNNFIIPYQKVISLLVEYVTYYLLSNDHAERSLAPIQLLYIVTICLSAYIMSIVSWLVCCFVGCFVRYRLLLLRELGPYVLICMDMCVAITVNMVMVLKEAVNFYVLLCRNNSLKRKSVLLFMSCYVHVLQ